MAIPSIETAQGWRGRVMVDRDNNKIGEVVDIYLDNETDRPVWPALDVCAARRGQGGGRRASGAPPEVAGQAGPQHRAGRPAVSGRGGGAVPPLWARLRQRDAGQRRIGRPDTRRTG